MAEGKGSSGSDNAVGYAIIGVIAAALCYFIWYLFEYQIKNGIRWIRYAEMWVVDLFTGKNFTVMWEGNTLRFQDWFAFTPEIIADCTTLANPDGVGVCLNNDTMDLISTMALKPMALPMAVILFATGLWALFAGPNTQYRRTMSIEGLMKAQSKIFPFIAPFVKFNPSNQPVRPPGSPVPAELPPFAEALGPEEWLAYYSIPVPDGVVDENAARKAFLRQLGAPWRGPMRLPPHAQVLLAAFCLKAKRKRKEADDMLGRVALCWSGDKGLRIDRKLLKEAQAVLRDRDICGDTLAKCNQHAFRTTALLRALLTAREEGGVLSPSQFLWLRAHDRELWYPLNNLGRHAYHMEALGAMSHFKKEKLTERPIPRPKVDDAVQAITEYMASDKARPVPALDYSKSSKKRGIKKIKGSKS